jgi:putative ABC transport system substrate-binding protein
MRRIGVLIGFAEDSPDGQRQAEALRKGLEKLDWVDGRNMRVDLRWAAGDPERMQLLARELVALQPDVLVSHSISVSIAVLKETRSIPIVFVNVSDPVGSRLVESFAHPGGNATGFTNLEPSMGGKWLEVLKDLDPTIRRVAFMFNPATAPGAGRYYLSAFETGAVALAVEPIIAKVNDIGEIEQAISALARQPNGGLIITPDIFLASHRDSIIELTARHRVSAIYPFRIYPDAGGLISHGNDAVDIFGRAASYVDRILKGANPADLPVQTPTKFELVINLKTAKALGLTINRDFLLRADELIE